MFVCTVLRELKVVCRCCCKLSDCDCPTRGLRRCCSLRWMSLQLCTHACARTYNLPPSPAYSVAELYTASLGSAALCSSVSLGGGKAVFGTADGRLFALALDGEIGPFTSPPAFFTGSNYEVITWGVYVPGRCWVGFVCRQKPVCCLLRVLR